MPEPRDPRPRLPVEQVGPEAPEAAASIELRAALMELISAIPEGTKQIAEEATALRTKLLERRLFGTEGGLGKIYSEAVQTQIDQLGITLADFEIARVLATVPAVDFPEHLQIKQRRVRELIIDSVDDRIKHNANLRNFFPNERHHQADLYQISYEYVDAHKRLDGRRDQGRDSMTGLINDQGFLAEVFEVELKLLALLEENRAMAVFRIDLDGFKAINDTYGHDEGDRVLKEFATNLREKFKRTFDITSILPDRESDSTEARPGGDEFAVIVNDIDTMGQPDAKPEDYAHYPDDLQEKHGMGNPIFFTVAKRIMDAAKAVLLPDGSTLTASIGYVRIHQEEASRMLYGKGDNYAQRGYEYYNRVADMAAKNAKEWGDGIVREWSPLPEAVPMTTERLFKKGLKRFKRDHPDLQIDSDIEVMLKQQAELLAVKYANLPKSK